MDRVELLYDLIERNGVVGFEEQIRERIKELIKDYVDEIKTDNLGNLYGLIEGERPHIALFAHMDELGMVVTNIDDNGFIYFRKMGGIDDRILPSTHVRIIAKEGEVAGVIGITPPHLMIDSSKDMGKVLPWHELTIDVGANSRKEVSELGIKIGDPIIFKKQFSRLSNNLLSSRGMDDRVGCLILIEIIKGLKDNKKRVTSVFTTQEEYGLRGSEIAGYITDPDIAIVVDTSSSPDSPNISKAYKDQFRLGQGPLLRIIDTRMVANPLLRDKMEEIANKYCIPYQLGVAGGSTDAASIQLSKEGIPVLPISVPCRYSHSQVEMVSVNDIDNTILLLREFIKWV
jgi:endoglucanase